MDPKINITSNNRQLTGQILSPCGGRNDVDKTSVVTNIANSFSDYLQEAVQSRRPGVGALSFSLPACVFTKPAASIKFWLLESTSGGRVEFFLNAWLVQTQGVCHE